MPETETQTELSMDDAAAQLEGLLGPASEAGKEAAKVLRGEDGKFKSTKPKEEEADKPLQIIGADGTPDEAADREAAEDAEPEDKPEEKPEEKPDEDDTDEDEEDKPAPRMHRVKVDGLEIDVDEEELKKGYSRQKDYTNKTKALAEERRKFEAEDVATVRAERQVYADRLDALAQAVETLMPDKEPDWNTLRNTATPEEFNEAFAGWRVQQQRMEKIHAEQKRVTDLQAADAERQFRTRLTQETELLHTALPDMADPVKGKQLKDDLIAYAKSLKFSDDDLAQVTDHRLLLMLDKARRFDEAARRKPKIEEKIDRALETIKPSTTTSRPKSSEIERTKTRFMQSHGLDDAAALISMTLPKEKPRR